MSGYGPAEDLKVINNLKITHILSVVPAARAEFESKGVKYLIFNQIQDNHDQNVLPYFEQANEFVHKALS